jgi:acylphosphatase
VSFTRHSIRHVVFHGRVQGVGFRAFVAQRAYVNGVEGWARNRRDGTVEAVFAAPSDVIGTQIEECRGGPPGARVDTLQEREGTTQEFARRRPGERFSVLPTD